MAEHVRDRLDISIVGDKLAGKAVAIAVHRPDARSDFCLPLELPHAGRQLAGKKRQSPEVQTGSGVLEASYVKCALDTRKDEMRLCRFVGQEMPAQCSIGE